MLRFFLRLLSLAVLTMAVMAATLDVIQSVASSEPVFTPLAVTWSAASPESLAFVADTIMNRLHPKLWDPVALWLLSQPASVVLLGVSLLLWMAGYRRHRPAGRFTA
ncbi:hypothetical protein [Mycoplana dimorpha]|uniref:Putative secreted protein with PEP-CTERM sorting signal n=1 Tax=Mycoplana dimorpha TaxID=28320 RepID=A0A2T5BE94_MYCDI|nr:hypothetical protein [Mycoplana dimorpha]PTM97306.1 putative secreted protein with PEP-CTERM sorting signal [Mycoplana dimorpha]